MDRSRIVLGAVIAALAAAGLWSSLHQLARLGAEGHGHDTIVVLLSPHHAITVLGPLTPLLLLLSAAWRARRSGRSLVPVLGGRELVGSSLVLEGAELMSGSMAHSWVMTSVLVLIAMAFSWLFTLLAVCVARLVVRTIGRAHLGRRGSQGGASQHWRIDVAHPSRVWLARRSRRGPPLACAVA